MESALASTAPRVIECPADLSGCSSLQFEGRNLLFACSHEDGSIPFVVVLGFFCGQKEDVITKDLIEPVAEHARQRVSEAVSRNVLTPYSKAHIFFL